MVRDPEQLGFDALPKDHNPIEDQRLSLQTEVADHDQDRKHDQRRDRDVDAVEKLERQHD